MSIMFLHVLYLVAITAEAMTAALAAGRRRMDWVGVCLLGCVTALGGGSLRDVLCNDIPLLFRRELYASVSIVTGGLYVAGLSLGLPHDPVMLAAMAIGLAMRLLALRFDWHMPKFVYTETLH
jgi:uncharacterized membrane protein YeiH